MTTATHHDLVSPRIEERLRRGQLTERAGRRLSAISSTGSTATCSTTASSPTTPTRDGSATGEATDAELAHFVRQFSVFSNQFLVAALLRVINAPTLQQARSAKEILMNELGVIYRRTDGERPRRGRCRRGGQGPRGRPRPGQHRGDRRRRAVPLPRRPLRVAAGRRRGAGAGLRRPGQAPARAALHAPLLRRAPAALRQRGRPDRRRGELRRRELGRRRLLAGAGGRPAAHQGDPAPRPQGRLLHLAQPRRGPARRPHHGRARRRLLRPRGSTRRDSSRARTKSSTPSPCSGTAWRTTGSMACRLTVADGSDELPRRSRDRPTRRPAHGQRRMALKRIDHVRMFVGNARQSAYFYRNAFGFDVDRLRGARDRRAARGVLRAPPGADHVRAGLAPARRSPRRPAPGPARRRRAVDRPRGRRRAARRSRPPWPRGAGRRRRRARSRTSSARTKSPRSMPMATRPTRFVNRSRYHGVFAPGLQAARPGSLQPPHVPPGRARRPSTTSSPTSRKARWATGSITTARSWASRCWPASTTRTSAPSTRP